MPATAIRVAHVLSPVLITLYYLIASIVSTFKSDSKTESDNEHPLTPQHAKTSTKTKLSLFLTAIVVILYIAESVVLACRIPSQTAAGATDGNLVFTLFSTLTWIILLFGLVDATSTDNSFPFYGSWLLALGFEAVLLVLTSASPRVSGGAQVPRLVLQLLRIALMTGLVVLELGSKYCYAGCEADDVETASLLMAPSPEDGTPQRLENGTCYGTLASNGHVEETSDSSNSSDRKDQKGKAGEKKSSKKHDEDAFHNNFKLTKNWWVYAKAFAFFLPYLWPSQSVRLQLHFPAIGLCLLANRATNVLIPLQLGLIVNILGETGLHDGVPWKEIGLYAVLRLLNSQAGISFIQSCLWLPVNKSATQRLSGAAYDHIMTLSADFHDSKRSGSTWQTVHRGSSISGLVQVLGFELVPMAADLIIAISVFWWLFDTYMAFIVAATVVIFLWSTKKSIALKTEWQRTYIKCWEDEYQQLTESSLNWATVSYFNRIKYEMARYAAAVLKTQRATLRYHLLHYTISALRSFALLIGLLAASCLAANQIIHGNTNVGHFVILLTYWSQLSGPLQYFASGFSRIAHYLVDAEKLLELMQKAPTVRDEEDAKEFVQREGEVEFDDVTFSYDGKRQITNHVTFRAESGQTIALVGETGGGKSTILKLLFRFYDVSQGRISIDGQDIRSVTLESLRANIAVVPQDPALFNETILENLQYANLEASEEEVKAACKAVALHDKIMSFTNGYEEIVGERGVKMSGGELQRMAIARAILKNPKILLLDEATSSVDSETEAQIQASLEMLCKGRTTFVIAHRLSTIVQASLVLVIHEGQIVERGTHRELLKAKAHYHKLWSRQLKRQSGAQSRSRSRSCSPTKSTAALINDISSGEDDVKILKRAVDESCGPKQTENSPQQTLHRQSGHTSDSHLAHSASHESEGRGRSPAKAITGGVRRRILHSKSPERLKSQSASPTRNILKADAPEFVPRSFQSNTSAKSSAKESGEKLQSLEEKSCGSEITSGRESRGVVTSDARKENSGSSGSGPIPKEKRPRLCSRTRSSPSRNAPVETNGEKIGGLSSVPETPNAGSDLKPENRGDLGKSKNETSVDVQHRRSVSPRRKQTQSEPFALVGSEQTDGTGDEDLDNLEGSGSGLRAARGGKAISIRRMVSAPVDRPGATTMAGNVPGGRDLRAGEDDISDEDSEPLASPRIKAPANTPAREGSEEPGQSAPKIDKVRFVDGV